MNEPNDPNDPFIWLPVIDGNRVEEIQLQSGMTGKQFKIASDQENSKHAPISRDKLEELLKGFKDYEVETIELNVVGAIETGGPLQFIIAGKAEAGMTVTLKKKGSGEKAKE